MAKNSKKIQVAYVGTDGAFCHIAAKKMYPAAELIGFDDFSKAYKSVEQGEYDCVVLPLENNYAGEVGSVTDLLFAGNLYVNHVIEIDVVHNLMACEGATLKTVKKVYSHQQALTQCDQFIKNHKLEVVPFSNTALAAKFIKELNDPTVAAIASTETADVFGLKILEPSINTKKANKTRFAAFTRPQNPVAPALIRENNGVDQLHMTFRRRLPDPLTISEMYPMTDELAEIKKKNDTEIKNIFSGKDKRLLVIIGPCSADREDAVIDYCKRLRKVQEKIKDKILICPRIYTNKPRTTGDGYKGMLHQPDANKAPDLLKGVIAIRKMHMRAIAESGFSCADEMLYPENFQYLADVLSYIAVGARSVENQQHRLVSSGIDVPVGMKNPTSGDLSVMMNSITAAQHNHTFLYSGWEVETKGNPLAHAILRGYTTPHGTSVSNYHYEDLRDLVNLYSKSSLKNPGVIVDCNHSNSGKQYDPQVRIAKEVLHSCRHNEEIKKMVKGLMIESYLEDGCQKPEGRVYGKSITDPCLGWDKTEKLLHELAELWEM